MEIVEIVKEYDLKKQYVLAARHTQHGVIAGEEITAYARV
jgi:hypothetical protein